MHILIAPNAFKNSLTAEEAAAAIGEGLSKSKLDCTYEYFPVGDGGDGTARLIAKKFNGEVIKTNVHDLLGRMITTSFSLIDDGSTAVIEMADASGLRLLQPGELDPLHASSFGTGELMIEALNTGVTKIIICMGGSATVDGGSGILKALGVRFLNSENKALDNLPASLTDLTYIDLSALDTRLVNCEITVLCDVTNVLLGPSGAAAIFGPQKGASQQDVKHLEKALTTFAKVVSSQTGIDISTIKHGGTAGGAAAGLYALINATLVNGIDHFLDLTNFAAALHKADLVITGEGSIDEQTLQGKAPFGVAARAKMKGIPVIALAGKVPVHDSNHLREYFDFLIPISHQPEDLLDALRHSADNLVRTSTMVGDLLALTLPNKL